jgi:hypothetical protein
LNQSFLYHHLWFTYDVNKWIATKTTMKTATSGLHGTQHHPENNVEASDNEAGNTVNKDTPFGQYTNQFHSPLGYRYLALQPPWPGARQ